MKKLDQSKTPYIEALKTYTSDEVAPFDVPGHHMGNIKNEATKLFGNELYRCDVNSPIGMDTLGNPQGVIKESALYLAEACNADEAFFLINGTSSGIIAMIMTAVKANEKIILPRNVHKSVINALILSGARPTYVMPEIDLELGIANQPTLDQWKKAIIRNPSAKAIFVINPTYFGSVGDLKKLVDFAHEHNMAVLVDEAHGAHYYFHHPRSPISAMDAGADMSAASFHKTVGSLTQSSALLLKSNRFKREDVQKTLNIINTTSPSGILIASIDAARSFMASKEGYDAMEETYKLVDYARSKIDRIPGFINENKEHFISHGSYDYDDTKLVIGIDHLNLDGFQIYHLLKERYDVQLELAEPNEVLAIFSIGTKKKHVDKLLNALRDISKNHYNKKFIHKKTHFDSVSPYLLVRPRVSFNAPGKLLALDEIEGAISKEQVMMYPPGIPLIAPGEVWSKDLVEEVKDLQNSEESHTKLLSSYKDFFEVIDTDKWRRFGVYEKRLTDYYKNKITTPLNDGFRFPFEGEEHQATFILMPSRPDTWRNKAKPAQDNYIQVIKAVAEHEKVIVGVNQQIGRKIINDLEKIDNVSVQKFRYNDAWARDNMPLFLTNGNSIRTVDFRFNAWGGKVDGLYSDYREDDELGALISKKFKLLSYYLPNFVLEGGSIAIDGEGTLITTEACLLSKGRNPYYRKEEIEEILRDYLAVEKIIWVPHGIYNDETNEHIDNMVSFIKPGEVVMAWCNNKKDPQYKYCHQTLKALEEATDAKGRKLIIHKLILPEPLYLTSEIANELQTNETTLDKRNAGRRLAASYVNYYQGKDFIIMPAFGVKEDKNAFETMKKLYPNKKIHQINTYEILLGGGNIHCISMQFPKEK